jgi:threonine synthase
MMDSRALYLKCQKCDSKYPLSAMFAGCPKDADALEVIYDYQTPKGMLESWKGRGGTWAFRELLPLPLDAEPVSLVEGGTPLVGLESDGPGRIWIKDETRNPTGAHKDRFHSVSVSMARHLGFDRVSASTTGNHGYSLAAYAAKAKLRCLIFFDVRSPELLRQGVQAFGARAAVLSERQQHLEWLVKERKWYPSTAMTPMPVATPFGVEGYKTIAYEIYDQLGQRMPSRVLIPVAVGDILYGPWKGFNELKHMGARGSLPRMHAVQSTGCDPIAQGYKDRADKVPVHPHPQTIAISIGDETAAPNSLRTLYQSDGTAETVPDAAILDAMRVLARSGIMAEPAGASAVAAALAMQKRGEFDSGEDVVCVVTGGGLKWPGHLAMAVEPHLLQDEDPVAVRAWIDAFDREGTR